jgi:dTDP-glucose pyrophosphorylase
VRYLIPIAAHETLFPATDFHFPKPLIEIDGEPMIARVIANLRRGDPGARFIFIVRSEDCRKFGLNRTLRLCAGADSVVVELDKPTAGAACSALMAIDHIEDDKPLVVANGDQIFDCDLSAIFAGFQARGLDAGVVTFESVHPRWSYVRAESDGSVLEAAEKQVISRNAVAGLYYFRRGREFVACATRMILNDRSVAGRFFVAPTLNEAILAGLKVGTAAISGTEYHSLYSPQRLELYERDLQARRRTDSQARPAVQVIIPMAGLGERFAKAGYDLPKPYIDVAGRPMIARVMDNLAMTGGRFVIIARRETLEHPAVGALTHRGSAPITVAIDGPTEGAACTVLQARARISPDAPLLIANCDQIVDMDCERFVEDCQQRGLDGSILVFRDLARDPKWSFAEVDSAGRVLRVAEKQPISDLATVGLYYFRRAGDFFDAAIDMIARNERVNGEFYVCPVYNHAIANGLKIGVYEIAADAMHGLGTPEDLHRYLAAHAA